MRLAIMQPYLFPYLGYFQLIRSVDAFVVYDDVNYINRGWINRNNILAQGRAQLFTLVTDGASQNKQIHEISVGGNRDKLLKTFQYSYGKAPQFKAVFPLIEDILTLKENNLARLLDYQLQQICCYLKLAPKWHISSTIKKDNQLRGKEKVLAICEELGAKRYINMRGGKALYEKEVFNSRGIQLSFLEPGVVSYRQFGSEFVPNLSIIDVMMFNDKAQCAKLLEEYELV